MKRRSRIKRERRDEAKPLFPAIDIVLINDCDDIPHTAHIVHKVSGHRLQRLVCLKRIVFRSTYFCLSESDHCARTWMLFETSASDSEEQ